jgi:ABC-type uncharacterized transport system substrate-binding protein
LESLLCFGGIGANGVSNRIDFADQFRRAAGYVDRILRGEKPRDLPVRAPTKYELVINLETAKALGLSVPQSLLSPAEQSGHPDALNQCPLSGVSGHWTI